MINCIIREILPSETKILEDFIYEAIFQRDENNLLPRNVINEPEIRIYFEDFGKRDDLCLVAEIDGVIIGAVWTRILSGEVKGYGNIDDRTPEFGISLFKDYRNKGIGTKLMNEMLILLRSRGYKQTSLAVQKDNYAARMYEKLGFKTVNESDEEYIMVYTFKERSKI